MTAWIYKLDKEQLADRLREQNVDAEGTFDELRQRLVQLAKRNPEAFHQKTELTGMQHERNLPGIESEINIGDNSFHSATVLGNAKIMNQIRKWGCHFDGRDPDAFLERVEDLSHTYDYPGEYLLRGLTEMLKGEALTWFRNNRDEWNTWEDFLKDFRTEYLPREYRKQMRREARSREQGDEEPFQKYATEIVKLMRRAGGFNTEEQLELVYDNMRPEHRKCVKLEEIGNIRELRTRVREIEIIDEQIKNRQKNKLRPPDQKTPTESTCYNKNECCWRCKQRGHTREHCKRPAKKFCSQCGRDGVLTRECHPRQGNERRAEPTNSAARPV